MFSNLQAMQREIGQTYSNKELTNIVNKLIDIQLNNQENTRKKKS